LQGAEGGCKKVPTSDFPWERANFTTAIKETRMSPGGKGQDKLKATIESTLKDRRNRSQIPNKIQFPFKVEATSVCRTLTLVLRDELEMLQDTEEENEDV
jgi:hypothetical protein